MTISSQNVNGPTGFGLVMFATQSSTLEQFFHTLDRLFGIIAAQPTSIQPLPQQAL